MTSNVSGLFDTHEAAEVAVRRLIAIGIDTRAISVVAANPRGTVIREVVDTSGDLSGEGAVSGATSGLLVGGLVGLLIGATIVTAPPIGAIIAGPLAGLITGAGVGMVSGGLLGAMIGLGIPEEEAHVYAESIRRGGTVVSVTVNEDERLDVQQILAMAGAVDIEDRAIMYREQGFSQYDSTAPVFTQSEIEQEHKRLGLRIPEIFSDVTLPGTIPAQVEQDFERDFLNSTAASQGASFEFYRPAYHFGYELAHRPEYRNLDWPIAEPMAREIWEKTNPGTWTKFQYAIQSGWSRAGIVNTLSGATVL